MWWTDLHQFQKMFSSSRPKKGTTLIEGDPHQRDARSDGNGGFADDSCTLCAFER